MRRLTVLSVAYPLAPVGPDAVGGAEQILSALDRALVAAGHRSVVVACEGSQVAGQLAAYPRMPDGHAIRPVDIEFRQRWTRRRIAQVMATEPVDLVHMHGLDYHACLPPPGIPVLATLHLPPEWYPPEALAPARPGTWVIGVSASQALRMPHGPATLAPVPNGVPVDRLGAVRPRRCGFALMLARVCPEKGLDLALQAAHAAGVSLLIGGDVFPYQAHQDYFTDRVRPLLDRRRRYLGPLDFGQKRRLLASARCLLVPSLVAETSSLVAMEAASCGTPVIAFRSGALPEVVEDGVTGFLVDDADGMARAMHRVHELDPDAIRAVAQRRFSHARMATEYIDRYQGIVGAPARIAA